MQYGGFEFPCGALLLLELITRPEEVKEDRLICPSFAEFEVVAVHRRFRSVPCRDIAPGAPGGENVENPVEEPPGIAPGSPYVGFLGWEVPVNDLPEVIIDLPKCHGLRIPWGGL